MDTYDRLIDGAMISAHEGITLDKELANPVSTHKTSLGVNKHRRMLPPGQVQGSDHVSYTVPGSIPADVITEEIITLPLINNLQTLMHIFKGNIGTGILSLPIAFMNAGLWTGLAGMLAVGAIAVHCMHMLIRCSDILRRRTGKTTLDYAGTMQVCLETGPPSFRMFSKFIRIFVNALLVFTQLGACCVYIIFVAKNIQQAIAFFAPNDVSVYVFEVCVMAVLLPFVCLRNLKLLAPFSAFANLLTITGLIIIIQYIVQGLPNSSKLPAISSFSQLPLFFGTAIFTVEGIGLVLPLRNTMKYPEDFGGWVGVLNLGMCGTVCLYVAIGFYGYLKFGDSIESTITLSLPETTLYVVVRLIFALSILITYNIQFYVPMTILWPPVQRFANKFFKERWFHNFGEYLFRITIVLITFGIAASIPHIDLLISLIGAVACSFLALILPALIEVLTLMMEDQPLPKTVLIKDVLIFLFGIFGTIIGTYTSMRDIVNTF